METLLVDLHQNNFKELFKKKKIGKIIKEKMKKLSYFALI